MASDKLWGPWMTGRGSMLGVTGGWNRSREERREMNLFGHLLFFKAAAPCMLMEALRQSQWPTYHVISPSPKEQ